MQVPSTETMPAYEAAARSLHAGGVRDLFGLMAEDTAKLIVRFSELEGTRYIGVRHENAAVNAAFGYAKASGKPGVCVLSAGPGFTNGLTGLVAAAKASAPVVALVPETPLKLSDYPKRVDTTGVLAAFGVRELRAQTPQALGPALTTALREACRTGPVAVSFGNDLLEFAVDSWAPVPAAPDGAADEPRVDPALVDMLAGELAQSRRPLLIAGRGAVAAGAREAIRGVAGRVGALLATTLPTNGWFNGDPYSIGIAGSFGSPVAKELVEQADCVLALGASLPGFVYASGYVFSPGVRLFQIDVSESALGASTPVTKGVAGDAGAYARALLAALDEAGVRSEGFRTAGVAERIADPGWRWTFPDLSSERGADPRALVSALDEVVPEERTVVLDSGHFMGYAISRLRVPDLEGAVYTTDYGCVGLGLGCAIGAAVARPDRLTVLGIGDGGTMMTLGDLETLVRYRLPAVVAVLNDRSYGAERHFLQLVGFPDSESEFQTPDFAAVARSLGAAAHTVRTPDDVRALRAEIASLTGPLVLDCIINPDIRAGWLEELFQVPGHHGEARLV